MYPVGSTDSAQVDSAKFDAVLLGENDFGSVHLHGPFGNQKSNVKIAYLIGMHPLESKSHRALFDKLTSNDDLNYCYYIYNINVKHDYSKSEGRAEGQMLANLFVKDHVIQENYDLFLDIHSNRGLRGPGDYEESYFVFAPGFDARSFKIVDMIVNNIDEIVYYVPEFRSSPPFITEPTSESGIPTVVYECDSYETMDVTYDLANKLVYCIDNLSLLFP